MERSPRKTSILSPLSIPKWNRATKNLRRIQQILGVLARQGFSALIERAGLLRLLPFAKKEVEGDESPHTIPDRLCHAFEELGPTFVKLGQMLASRPDLIPADFVKAFARLQDNVRPLPLEEIRTVVHTEFEESPDTLFASFDPSPLAAASVAQVHRASLHGGEEVVVKVQRPGIVSVIETDLSILFWLAKLSERYIPELSLFNPVGIIDEFSQTIRRATDFMEEAHNIDAMRDNFEGDESIVIPEVIWELTSKRVVTMHWIDGIPLYDVERLKREGYDVQRLCAVGVQAFFRQVFVHGIFHADLHGGNVFALPGNRIAFVDFGEIGRLGTNALTSIANIFVSLMARDFYSIAREYLDLGTTDGPVDLDRFADDLERFLSPFLGRKIRDVALGEILTKAASIAVEHRIRLPRDLVLLGRVILATENLVRQLDPEFDLLEHGGTLAAEIVKDRLKPERLARDVLWNLRDIRELSRTLPTHLKYIFQKLSKDELKVNVDISNLSRAADELDRASNRLAFAVVIAGLVIGSSVLTFADRGPEYFSMPVFGLVGYLLAGLLGVGLLISILRSRKY